MWNKRLDLKTTLYIYHYCAIFLYWDLFHALFYKSIKNKKSNGSSMHLTVEKGDFLSYIKTPTIWNTPDHSGHNYGSYLIVFLLWNNALFYFGPSLLIIIFSGVLFLYLSRTFKYGVSYVSFLCIGDEYVRYFTRFHRAPLHKRKHWIIVYIILYSVTFLVLILLFIMNIA